MFEKTRGLSDYSAAITAWGMERGKNVRYEM